MDRMKKFIDLYWPVESCNFNCEYCYVHQHKENMGKRFQCLHTPEEIRRALSAKRLGGVCLITICAGGETLLEDSIVPIVNALLEEGHYINLVTNGMIRKNINALLKIQEKYKKHLLFKFSFHFAELKRKNLIGQFFENVDFVRKEGCSVSLELPAYDDWIPYENEIKSLCIEKTGGVCHVTTLRDESKSDFGVMSCYNFAELKKIWGSYHSGLFQCRTEVMEKRYRGFCYAGDWGLCINLGTGEVKQCHYERVLDNIYTTPDLPLKLHAVGNCCHSEYCYVCHAFLLLGLIPELDLGMRYDDVRDRPEAGWLTKEMQEFMHQRLDENNRQYSFYKKFLVNRENSKYAKTQYQAPVLYSDKIMREMKNQAKLESYVIVEAKHSVKMMYKKAPKELNWLSHLGCTGDLVIRGEEIKIKALGTSCEEAEGNEIWVVGALVDDYWYDAEVLFEPVWLKRMRMYGWRSWDSEGIRDEIAGMIPEGKRRTLVFEKNRWRGICRIEFQGQEKTIDTWGSEDDALLYVEL